MTIPQRPHGAARPADPIPAKAGIGLRFSHHGHVLRRRPDTAWFEVHPENYLDQGVAADDLEAVRRDYSLSLHATGLSLGSADGVHMGHLAAIAALQRRIATRPDLRPPVLERKRRRSPARPPAPALHRRGAGGRRPQRRSGPGRVGPPDPAREPVDLSPLCRERADRGRIPRRAHAVHRLRSVARRQQHRRHRRQSGERPADRLADILRHVPTPAIGEIHLAGHAVRQLEDGATLRIDDHGSPVSDEVWALYERLIVQIGARPTLIEWDTAIPTFETLQGQAAIAQRILDQSHARSRRPADAAAG